MDITAEMLFYRLSKKHTLRAEQVGTPGSVVRGIRIWREEKFSGEAGILYLLEGGPGLRRRVAEEQGCFLVCGSGRTELPEFLPGDTYAVLEEDVAPERLQTELWEAYGDLMRWDARFYEAVVRREDARRIMAQGREMLAWGYAVIDADMKILYQTPDYRQFLEKKADYLPREITQSLMMNPDFHAAAELKESFYYFEENNGREALCGNIFLGGAYYARTVMYVGEKGTRVPAGAREIFERFITHLEEVFTHSPDLAGGSAGDQLHHLFQMLAAGKETDASFRSAVLKRVGWKNDDLYAVIKLRFYETEGWSTHLDTALPYLTRELEREWGNSCAVIEGMAILWIINLSLSGEDTDRHTFHQRVASFVRDHVCNAGVSSRFRDFSLAPCAVRAANVALRIGQAKHPHFWYYLFDDYRLAYMLEKCREELPSSMLCHPALMQLLVYDEEHHTELARTLQAYLQCGLNMTAAAKRIYVHRTTFCRRMDYIRRLTGLDIEEPDTILTLLMSCRLMEA